MHSKIFRSEWRKMAKDIKKKYPKLNIGEVVCTNSPGLL